MDRATTEIDRQVFGLLYEHTSEAIFTVARDTARIVSANERLEDLTGRSREALVGSEAELLFASDAAATAKARAQAILEREGLHEEIPMARLDGYPVVVSLTVAHVEHPISGALAACIARDITERQMLERELISKHVALFQAHHELERVVRSLESRNQELAEKNHELSLLGARLSQASRRALIGELSAGIAHSLNNPLAALVSANRQIERVVQALGSDELKQAASRFLKRASDTAARMEQIIQAVRRAHRSGQTMSRAQALAVQDELDIALALFEPRFSIASIRVERERAGPEIAWGSAADLQHILWNLLDNAVLSMPEGGTLFIRARSDGDNVVLSIEDTGAGVPPERQRMLFEPFITTREGGSGLGLVTARRLARQWNGDVSFVPGTPGARFEIRLPTKELPCPEIVSSS